MSQIFLQWRRFGWIVQENIFSHSKGDDEGGLRVTYARSVFAYEESKRVGRLVISRTGQLKSLA